MSAVTIRVDGREVEAVEGESLLFTLLDGGFDIPNLCAMPRVDPPEGGCRLCWVEIEGRRKPVTACTQRVETGMVVRTRTEAVDRLVRSGFEMLMSVHRLDCKVCPGNRRCALQQIARARRIPLRVKRFPLIVPDHPVDESREDLGLDPNHCVLCKKCVHVCNHEVKKGVLDISRRGLAAVISTFDGEPLASQDCGDCTRCAEVCPVGAIYLRRGKGTGKGKGK